MAGLAQLQKAGTGFVGLRGAGPREHESREQQKVGRPHGDVPPPVETAFGDGGLGFSIVTSYFWSSRS